MDKQSDIEAQAGKQQVLANQLKDTFDHIRRQYEKEAVVAFEGYLNKENKFKDVRSGLTKDEKNQATARIQQYFASDCMTSEVLAIKAKQQEKKKQALDRCDDELAKLLPTVKTEEELQQEIDRLLKEIEELRRKPIIVPTVVPDDPRLKELEKLLKE